MRRLPVVLLVMLCLTVSATGQEREPVRFACVDVYLDSKDVKLAAYQVELDVTTGKVRIVGIEGGEHAAFAEPPYYDPAALAQDRVILAAFNTGDDLPNGRTRVARVHVQITGEARPEYRVKPTTAASSDGKEIAVEASTQEQGEAR